MTTHIPAVLVLGARGRFGSAATQAFAGAGWRVLAQARRAPADLPPGARHLDLPLADTAGLAAAAAGAQVVIYAANPLYTHWAEEALPMARQGMDIAQALGATFMLPGNVYNFGRDMPARLRADTPQRPDTRKGRIRHDMEIELQRRAEAGRLRAVVIRAGDFFGAAEGTWLDLMIAKSLRQGRLTYPGPTDRLHAWAYLPDLAQAFVAAASKASALAPFSTLHFPGHSLTGAGLLAAIEGAAGDLGIRPDRGWRHGTVPWPLLRALGWFVPMLREVAEMAYLWRVPHALDGADIAQVLGPLPTTPLETALRLSLARLAHGDQPEARAAA